MIETGTPKELPADLLLSYGLDPTLVEKREGYWYVESGAGKFAVFKYKKDPAGLSSMLQWQKHLVEKGCRAVLMPIETKDKKGWVDCGEGLFYLVSWIERGEFQPRDPAHLRLAVQSMSRVHHLSRDFNLPTQYQQDILGLRIIQNRLVEILAYYQKYKGKRLKTDFERVFVEHFSFAYDQGQESLEQMVLSGYGLETFENCRMIINGFRKQKIGITGDEAVFLELHRWSAGPFVADLALFLNSYLALHKWDVNLVLDLIGTYEAINTLKTSEKYMLMALLRFPYRFWFYACQYFREEQQSKELAKKLRQYIMQIYWRDKCLDVLDGVIWEGKR